MGDAGSSRMMRLIDQPSGTGDLRENDHLWGAVHYSLNVYQQYASQPDEVVRSRLHIEGHITPAGTIDMGDLWSRGAQLVLHLSDGRTLTFQIRDDRGKIINALITTR
jgi:hypothetical protein